MFDVVGLRLEALGPRAVSGVHNGVQMMVMQTHLLEL